MRSWKMLLPRDPSAAGGRLDADSRRCTGERSDNEERNRDEQKDPSAHRPIVPEDEAQGSGLKPQAKPSNTYSKDFLLAP